MTKILREDKGYPEFLLSDDEKKIGKNYVYCVYHGEYEDYGLMAVFSTLEKAEGYASTWSYQPELLTIVEEEVDPE